MGGSLLKLRAWWETADRTTKTVTMVGGGLLVALLIFVFYLSSSPDMKMLFPALEPTEQGRVVQKLQELKVPYKLETDGSIYVPGAQVSETRARLASAGLPANGSLGWSRLGDMGMTDSASLQAKKMQVAQEEELQKTIMAMAPVAAAKVSIAQGEDSPFADMASEPTASVVVELRSGTTNSRDIAAGIVSAMTGAVEGLKAQNVSVIDNNGIVLFDGKTEGDGGSSMVSKKREAELAEASRLKRDIESMIITVAGPGKAKVSAFVEMNFDREDVTENSETPTKPISSAKVTETYGSGGPAPAGGAASAGAPASPPTTAGAANGYSQTQEQVNHGITKGTTVKSVAPGKVVAARISIMLDEGAADKKTQIEAFASNLIGATPDSEAFKVTVATATFDKSVAEAATKQLAAAKSGQMMQQIISLIPVFALLIVGFLVIKAIAKTAGNNRNVMVTAGAIGRGGGYASLPAGSTQMQQQNALVAVDASRPASEYPDDLGEAARKRVASIKQNRPDVEEIPEKFDLNLAQLLKMAEQRPESVAMLVKSWLLEETR